MSSLPTSLPLRTVSSADLGGSTETIIVGAGLAGLACARRLHDAGHPFRLVAENVGGRVRRSRDGTANLGAYYVRADYTHVKRFVHLGRRIDRLAIRRHVGAASYTYWDHRLLLSLPQAARFLRLLAEFRRRYAILKPRSVQIGQAAAIREDPMLFELYEQPAADLVAEHRIADLAHWYLAPGLHGTAFASLHEITAFMLLLGALPVIVPAYEFTPQFDRLIRGFEKAIVADTVTAIRPRGGAYDVDTAAGGSTLADRVVVAVPTEAARRLLDLPSDKRAVAAHTFHVSGTLRAAYAGADIHLFAESDPTLAIVRHGDGTYLFGSRHRDPDLGRYFSSWKIRQHKHWNPAFHVGGTGLVETEQGPGLYLIGDHNIVGLEDAFLTGLHAANRIISTSRRRAATP